MSEKHKSQLDIEWEQRVLCSDESCIGVIGKDGHCKECGKPFEGALPWIETSGDVENDNKSSDITTEAEDLEPAPTVENEATGDEEASEEDPSLDWQRRTLCSDESCIGVIGADGKCKECGKTYEGTLPWLTHAEDTGQTDEAQTPDDEREELP
jgi:hypothetical protein